MQTIIDKLKHHKKFLFFLLSLFTGIWALYPFGDFQYYLATGDHGRDLYAAQQTLKGALPYQDYAWLFGPLMPYYYALFFTIFDISIQSVLLGQNILILLAGLLIYLSCSVFLSPTISFVCAVWYWAFRNVEFFYTYNHIGGIVMILATVYVTLLYLRKPKIQFIYAGSLFTFLLILIRPNMGMAIFIAYFLNIIIIDITQKHKYFLNRSPLRILLPSSILLLSALIYGYLLHPLEGYEIYQSFPYGKFQRTDTSPSVLGALIILKNTLILNFTHTFPRKLLSLSILASIGQIIILLFQHKIKKPLKTQILLVSSCISIFIFFGIHEFIGSGTFYRLNWIFACFFILIFYVIAWLMHLGPKKIFTPFVQFFIILLLLTPAILKIKNDLRNINFSRATGASLHIGKTHIYTSQNKTWTQTVQPTVEFIKTHVPKNEKILAIPFDTLYYFLSEREGASRQTVFFDHIIIPEEQEHKIIQELKDNNINWVILSSRIRSVEAGMGTFGETYCPLIAEYLNNNFKIVKQFGDWINPGGWTTPHGTRILRRN
ncbi:hypothetical protein MNBD_UNCLBAC01-1456 [hydrothermal vent metagenome]|uniref:Glycosyltransferase RgtA/B/C/D-like domain-containing protein n=1 Tax=hydrothermal vent metagenome TaxID=652676 RepID=A0A3B1E1E2_9ZZZZ